MVGDEVIHAHKAFLDKRSPFFVKKFQGDREEDGLVNLLLNKSGHW